MVPALVLVWTEIPCCIGPVTLFVSVSKVRVRDSFSALPGEVFLRWFPDTASLSGAVSGANVQTQTHVCPRSLSLPKLQLGASFQVGTALHSDVPICWTLCLFPRGHVYVGSHDLGRGHKWRQSRVLGWQGPRDPAVTSAEPSLIL